MDIVAVTWESVPRGGNPFMTLDRKLRATSKSLKRWSDRWIGNVKLHIAIALEVIQRLDKAMDMRALSKQEWELWRLLKHKLLGLCSLERAITR